MKLSRLERSVLRSIKREYTIVYDPSDKSIIAVGERSLLTAEAISTKCKTPLESTKAAVSKLVSYQCIAKVYLFSTSEFKQQWMGGKVLRLPLAAPPAGKHCDQMTNFGQEVLGGLAKERAKHVVSKWISNFSKTTSLW
jgi:hypothetical protein